MIRRMVNEFRGVRFYESTFNTETGDLCRVFEVADSSWTSFLVGAALSQGMDHDEAYALDNAFRKESMNLSYARMSNPFSPAPETVDIQITNSCPEKCTYCYMDSLPGAGHGPKDLVETAIKTFEQPPYQIAIGGGEPTLHPDFVEILHTVRELGSVPNYTTAGYTLSEEIVEATNEVCGGIAMTYHVAKGLDWFKRQYKKICERLDVQVNVHLIADDSSPANLSDLIEAQNEIGNLNLVLLAFYPDIGRAGLKGLPSKQTYHSDLPQTISRALESGMKISFSEGLLPYFLSRPEIGVNTTFASRSEGLFSCYIDVQGRMSHSSFSPPTTRADVKVDTVYTAGAQSLWDSLQFMSSPYGGNCYDCAFSEICTTPNLHHYLICAHARHNDNDPPRKEKING